MGLESSSSTSIAQLDAIWPLDGEPRSQGAAHLRLIKQVLKDTFPGVGGQGYSIPITTTEAELNYVSGVTSALQTQLNAITAAASAIEAALQLQTYTAFTTTGTAPNFVLTTTPVVTSLSSRLRYSVKFHANGTGSDLLSVDGLTSYHIVQFNSSGSYVPPVITAGMIANIEFDSSNNYWVIIDPLPPAVVQGITGELRCFAMATPPSGWLTCPTSATTLNGVSRTTYSALFTAIGGATSVWGVNPGVSTGDGSTTFNLPWVKQGGVFVNGVSQLGVATAGQMPAHTHTQTNQNGIGGSGYPGWSGTGNPTASGQTGSAGSGTDNLAAGVYTQWAVKT